VICGLIIFLKVGSDSRIEARPLVMGLEPQSNHARSCAELWAHEWVSGAAEIHHACPIALNSPRT
jgi:hypothetical protein